MSVIVRMSDARIARQVAVELATDGFLAHAAGHDAPVVVVHCATKEQELIANRIRRRDPSSLHLRLDDGRPLD